MKSNNEFSIIERLTKFLPQLKKEVIAGPGDDCAVIKHSPDTYLLATCDTQTEDIHFSAKYSTPQQIGQKAVAVNVSDIAAMAGKPTYCLVSIIVPEKHKSSYLNELYKGISQAAKLYNVQVIGGNLSRGEKLTVDIFMLGQVKPDEVVYRSGAKPGDKIFVTGTLGDAAAGLLIIKNRNIRLDAASKKYLINKQIIPTARLKESKILSGKKQITAMIDISDGLSSDILHICDQSNAGVELYAEQFPISSELKSLIHVIDRDPADFILSGGEDYELLFTAPAKYEKHILKTVTKKAGTPVTVIGEIIPKKKGRWIQFSDGKRKLLRASGWSHFKKV